MAPAPSGIEDEVPTGPQTQLAVLVPDLAEPEPAETEERAEPGLPPVESKPAPAETPHRLPSHVPTPAPRSAPAPQPSRKSPIEEAIEHAERIVGTLKATLEEMEDVLELLEIAQVQKSGDEREITELRRTLQRLQHHEPDDREDPAPRHGRRR